jgi:hypothetical protein
MGPKIGPKIGPGRILIKPEALLRDIEYPVDNPLPFVFGQTGDRSSPFSLKTVLEKPRTDESSPFNYVRGGPADIVDRRFTT